jgi:murein hydrolase activator
VPLEAQTVAEDAARASSDLQAAVGALETATEARDRVSALSQTIRAYEEGLAALRASLRQAAEREATLTRAFEAKREGIGSLLGVLATIEANPGPLLLLHPDGALGTARSGMLMADVTPALQTQALALKAELTELAELRSLQLSAGETLKAGLAAAQTARITLSQAISDRTDLPMTPRTCASFWKARTRWTPLLTGCHRMPRPLPDSPTRRDGCPCRSLASFCAARERLIPQASAAPG